ncbi:hypothetical protein H9M94_00540 [Mycoplasma sp. Pen4]|uniref:MHO_4530 family protein n=1 Tax=Mycoplasma sp. Pen4 TaxID=640330 RepID=UPI0016544E7C|nr:hypothetical protein [Mycoplasma sp. Pen4]QNM93751.1 hypothetical protein H9M94_00540 [Mycoplasma sp. Pen4]
MIIALIIFVIIALVLLTTVFIFAFYYFYYRSSSGIITFKIDNNNARVMRDNDRNRFLSTIFDTKKVNFDKYHFIPLDTFLNIIQPKQRKLLENHLSENLERKYSMKINANPDFYKNLGWIEKIIVQFDKWFSFITTYHLKIVPTGVVGEYTCFIKWQRQKDKHRFNFEIAPLQVNETTNQDKIYKENLVVGFALKPYYFDKKIDNEILDDIIKTFNFTTKSVRIYREDGIIYMISKLSRRNSLKRATELVNGFNRNMATDKMFLSATAFQMDKVNSTFSKSILINLLQYSLFNIINDPTQYSKFTGFNLKTIETPEYKIFVNNLNRYINENNNIALYPDDTRYLKMLKFSFFRKYATNQKIAYAVANINLEKESNNSDETKKWIEFFNKIPFLNYKNEHSWYKYISNASRISQQNKQQKTTILVKVSQETFLNKELNLTDKTPVCLIYAYNNMFNSYELKQKISKCFSQKIPTALYINKVDKSIINILNDSKINVLVIGKNISENLHQNKNYLDCVGIVNLAKNNKIKVVYEDVREDLDPLIVQKTKLDVYYKTNDNDK